VSDNIFLGTLRFPIAAKKAGEISADVRFTYDVSGVLEAEVTVLPSQEKHKLVITENAGVMTPQEIEQRLAELNELKIHPRDRIENRTLLARAERLYQQLRGATREHFGLHIAQFERILETQDARQIAPAATLFRAEIDSVEQQSFLAPAGDGLD
jgi:molecular chaperone HscC